MWRWQAVPHLKFSTGLLVDDPALRAQVPWDKMHVFFGDERHVGPDDPESNFCMASETMFSKSPLKPEQVTRIKGEYPEAEDAAKEYDQSIRTYFKLASANSRVLTWCCSAWAAKDTRSRFFRAQKLCAKIAALRCIIG